MVLMFDGEDRLLESLVVHGNGPFVEGGIDPYNLDFESGSDPE
jgi:hypothetical protein